MVTVDDGDISITQSLAKLAESQKFLAEVLQNDLRVQQANRPAVLRSAAEVKRQSRRNSFDLQMNIMGLATGGRVIRSLDNDDILKPSDGLRTHGGSIQNADSDKVRKSYELLHLITGGR
jgi:hypothetical protein